jgi:hypothetical protein
VYRNGTQWNNGSAFGSGVRPGGRTGNYGYGSYYGNTNRWNNYGSGRYSGYGRYGSVPSNIHRHWDNRRDYAWNHHRYHWGGNSWVVIDSDPYYYAYDGPIGYYGSYGSYGGPYDEAITYETDVSPSVTEDVPYSAPPAQADGESLTVDVQRALADAGYYRGELDGILGPGTRSAIQAYQAEHGMDQTGRISERLIRSLGL